MTEEKFIDRPHVTSVVRSLLTSILLPERVNGACEHIAACFADGGVERGDNWTFMPYETMFHKTIVLEDITCQDIVWVKGWDTIPTDEVKKVLDMFKKNDPCIEFEQHRIFGAALNELLYQQACGIESPSVVVSRGPQGNAKQAGKVFIEPQFANSTSQWYDVTLTLHDFLRELFLYS